MSAQVKELFDYNPKSWIIDWIEPNEEEGIIGTIIKPGNFYYGIPNELYHRGPGISKSGLDLIRRSPRHYKFIKEHPKPRTRDMHIGDAFHVLTLEPDVFAKKYVQAKYAEFRTKEAKEWKQQVEAEGKFVIRINTGDDPIWNASEWDTIHRMRDSVMSHPMASAFLDSGIRELAGYWIDTNPRTDTHKLCKLKIDWYSDSHNVLVDLKSTIDASYTKFARSIIEYRYYIQDAFYREGMFRLKRPVDEFIFVSVEKDPPYSTTCYVLDKSDVESRDIYNSNWQRDLVRYAECKDRDEWPDYPEIRDMILPKNLLRNIRIY